MLQKVLNMPLTIAYSFIQFLQSHMHTYIHFFSFFANVQKNASIESAELVLIEI